MANRKYCCPVDDTDGCCKSRSSATALDDIVLPEDKIEELIRRAKELALVNGVQMGIAGDGWSTSKASFAPMTLFPSPMPYIIIKQAKLIQTEYNRLMHKVAYDHEFLEESLRNFDRSKIMSLGKELRNPSIIMIVTGLLPLSPLIIISLIVMLDTSEWFRNNIVQSTGERTSSVVQVDKFTKMLWDIYTTVREEGNPQPISLGLFRNDYMTNIKNRDCNCDSMPGNLNFKQIEFNTVAASFSGLASGIWNVHRHTMSMAGVPYNTSQMPENQPSAGFAKGLVKAWEMYNQPEAAIVMVVSEKEANFVDQRWIEKKVFELNNNIKFTYTCLKYSGRWILDDDKRLYINDMEIAVVYFRDGYSPAHYTSNLEKDARLTLERSRAIKCPSVQYHLAGCKKIQQTLAVPGALERFIKDPSILQKIKRTFAEQYSLDKGSDGDYAIHLALSCPQNFVLKPQREGGGNNVYGEDIRDFLNSIKDTEERNAYILMERIFPVVQRNILLKEGVEPVLRDVISEIGVYGTFMGSDTEEFLNEEVGLLLRTKVSSDNEGGIVAGFATIDSAFLQD